MGALVSLITIILYAIGIGIGGAWLAGIIAGGGWLIFAGYLFGRKAVRLEYEARREQDIRLMLALAQQFQSQRAAPSIEDVSMTLRSPRPHGKLERFLQQIT
jgi:hypothetical protein